MRFDARLRNLERHEEPVPPCPACGARDGSRVVVWRQGKPHPQLDCQQCQARVVVFKEVAEGMFGKSGPPQ